MTNLTTSLQALTQQIIANDPDRLAADNARLRAENQRLTDLLDLYKFVPFRYAINATRAANGLPALPHLAEAAA